jgi:hypothetical protein
MMVSGSGAGSTSQNLTYFRPSEVTLLLRPIDAQADVPALLSDPAHSQSLVDASDRGDFGRPLHAKMFARSRGRADREPIIMKRVSGARVLQTVNLEGWLPEELITPPDARAGIVEVTTVTGRLNARADNGDPVKLAGFEIVAATPNWWGMPFVWCGCGCPGGLPQPPAKPLFNPGVDRRRIVRFRHPGGGEAGVDQVGAAIAAILEVPPGEVTSADGQNVTVVVFDTWPMNAGENPLAKIAARHDGMKGSIGERPEAVQNQILRFHKKAKDGGVVAAGDIKDYVTEFSSAPDTLPCRHRSCECRIEDPVDMADHGLFVADVIKDIAPAATVRVYRVLSDMGMGEVDTIALAVEKEIAEASTHNNPVILNLSLGFGPQMRMMIDLLSDPTSAFDSGDDWICGQMSGIWRGHDEDDPTIRDLQDKGLLERMDGRFKFRGALAHLQWLLSPESLPPNVIIVGAAGNDSCGDRKAPPRLPAAIEGILGVSALDGDFALAHYSNLDDIDVTIDDGVGAYGGTANGAGQTTDGIVGLYVSGQLPAGSGNANQFGWAMWAGTSFAAPIVSGFVACLWSEMRARAVANGTTAPGSSDVLARTPRDRIELRQRF